MSAPGVLDDDFPRDPEHLDEFSYEVEEGMDLRELLNALEKGAEQGWPDMYRNVVRWRIKSLVADMAAEVSKLSNLRTALRLILREGQPDD